MSHFVIDPNWGVPLGMYLERLKNPPFPKYPIHEVKSAIEALVPNSTINFSDSTLEAVISVIYYPELLEDLVNKDNLVICLYILIQYCNQQPSFARSFGYLLLQIIGIITLSGFLEQNGQLTLFISSLSTPPSQRGADISPWMTSWTMKYINEGIISHNGRLIDLVGMIDWRAGQGHSPPTCLAIIGGHDLKTTRLLLAAIFAGRNNVLKAQAHLPSFGYPVILIIIWSHLRLCPYDDEQAPLWPMLRDIVFRYFLVARPVEQLLMETLVNDIAQRGNIQPFPPIDVADAEVVVITLMHQLASRQNIDSPIKLRYLMLLVEYTLGAVDALKLFHFYSTIFTSAFDRLWHDLARTCREKDGESWENVLYYSNALINAIMTSTGRPGARLQVHIPILQTILLPVDLVNMAGRLLLLPLAAIASSESGKPAQKETFEETLSTLSNLMQRLSRDPELTYSILGPDSLDWLKILNYIHQLQSMSLPSSNPLRPYLKKCDSVWLKLGGVMGCLDQLKSYPCPYPRCAGAETSVVGRATCHQADWLVEDSQHRLACPRKAGL